MDAANKSSTQDTIIIKCCVFHIIAYLPIAM